MRNFELEEAIRAAPADLDAYEVYADWLLERDVAHGELISFAVRRRRAGNDGSADFATLAAEARLLRDRTRMFGEVVGSLPRELVEIDLELGFFAAVRLYTLGERAGRALRAILTDRAGALTRAVAVLAKTPGRDPIVVDDRKTAKAVWSVLEQVALPRSIEAVALPLVADARADHFEALARVPDCTFPLRNVGSIVEHRSRLRALESLTLTTTRSLDDLIVGRLCDHAPVLATIPRLTLRAQYAFAAHRATLREVLPHVTFG